MTTDINTTKYTSEELQKATDIAIINTLNSNIFIIFITFAVH